MNYTERELVVLVEAVCVTTRHTAKNIPGPPEGSIIFTSNPTYEMDD